VEFHFGELFPRLGFIVTNLGTPSRAVVRFYNKRGTAEQWIKEGKQAVKMTCLSCHRFRSNQVRLALSLLAYNLGSLWRRLALSGRIENWSLTSLPQPLVKTGGRLVKHALYYWLFLAEGHLNRRRFGAMLGRIALVSIPTGQVDGGPVSSGIRLQRVGVRRGVAKVGHKWDNFGLCWCGWQTVGGAPDENRFTVSRTSETGVLWRCLRSQKGNSGKLVCHATRSSRSGTPQVLGGHLPFVFRARRRG
jgi:hypothetical protein